MTIYKVDELDGLMLANAVAKAQGWAKVLVDEDFNEYYEYRKNGTFQAYVDSYRPDKLGCEISELIDQFKVSITFVSCVKTDGIETEPAFVCAEGRSIFVNATVMDENKQVDDHEDGTMPTMYETFAPTYPVAVCRLVVKMLHGDEIELDDE